MASSGLAQRCRSRVFLLLSALKLSLVSSCQDMPGWVDSAGDSCEVYMDQNWCNGPNAGWGWDDSWGDIEGYALDGVSAFDACCGCQCGASRHLDAGGDGCDYYDTHPEHCGCCDTDLFVAAKDCCSCAAFDGSMQDQLTILASWPQKATKLVMPGKGFTGEHLDLLNAVFQNLTNLRHVDLHDNQLPVFPRALLKATSLEALDFSYNGMTDSIPADLGKMVNLTSLNFAENQLSGSIPPELGRLSKLRDLSFYSNRLAGGVPPELGQLSSLETLYLDFNELVGGLPAELGQLSALRWFSASSNQLTNIPSELGNLTGLEALDLDSNRLAGSIPAELGQMASLRTLDLSFNELTGSIPAELGRLSQLTFLGIMVTTMTSMLTQVCIRRLRLRLP